MQKFAYKNLCHQVVHGNSWTDYYMPKAIAATHRLEREFETVRMTEDENPLLTLGRVDEAADELAMLGCGKGVDEANRHIANNLSSVCTRYKVSLFFPALPSPVPRSMKLSVKLR